MKEKASNIAKSSDKYVNVLKEDYNLSVMLLALRLIKPSSKVLSVGCGAGREVKYLVRELNCDVTALDYDNDMIESSIELEPNAEYFCEDALKFIRNEEYDYIVCLWNTINFLKKEERKKLIEVCYRNLKNKGKLIITTSHIFQNWRFLFHNLKYWTSYYYFPKEISYWFKDTDFKVEKIKVGHSHLIIAEK